MPATEKSPIALRLRAPEAEVLKVRNGFAAANRTNCETLASLRTLTVHAREAASRAATAAERSAAADAVRLSQAVAVFLRPR